MILDRTKGSLDNFRALVKTANPNINLTDLNSVVGNPVVGAFANGNNTKLEISALKNKGCSGLREVFYKRCSLTEGLLSPITQIILLQGELAAAVGLRIMQALNILPNEVTVNDGAGWNTSGNQVIKSNANSLCYLPNQTLNINVISSNFTASFEVTLGYFTSVPYKGNTAIGRTGVGVIGTLGPIDLDTGHNPPAGTTIGSIQKNPGGRFVSFYAGRDPGYESQYQVGISRNVLPTPPDQSQFKFTNLLTGASKTVTATLYDAGASYPLFFSGLDMDLTSIGVSTTGGGKLGIDIL